MIRHTNIYFIEIIAINEFTGSQMKYAKEDYEHTVDATDFFNPLGYNYK